MNRLDEIKAKYAPYNGRTMTFSHERDIDWLIICVQGLNAEVKRLNREIDRLEWFEQHFQPGEPCRFCGCFKHTDDCAFVTHTQEGAEDER